MATTTPPAITSPAMLTKEVCSYTRMSRAALYAAMAEGRFPKPFKLGKKRVAWHRTTVEKWLEERMEGHA